MRYSAIFTLLALLGVFLVYYALNYQQVINWQSLDPVLVQKQITTQTETIRLIIDYYNRGILFPYLKYNSISTMTAGMTFIISRTVGAVHILVDKFFFKKFYEKANVLLALRRSVLIGILPIGLVLLIIYGYFTYSLVILLAIILVLVEVILTTFGVFAQQPDSQSEEGIPGKVRQISKSEDGQESKVSRDRQY